VPTTESDEYKLKYFLNQSIANLESITNKIDTAQMLVKINFAED